MSVAAMTMDDQRPLMNSAYDKMTTKYEQTMHAAAANVGAGAAAGGNGGATTTTIITSSSVSTTTAIMAAPPSGPASPTPSGPEEPHHHHHNNHHHHHHQHHHHTTPPQLQQQQQAHHLDTSASSTSATPQQQQAVAAAAAEQRQRLLEDEIEHLKVEQSRLSQQCADAQRREKILMRRLANKEQEFQDYVSQIAEYKAAQAPSAVALRSALLDPAVNLLFEKLKKELKATKAKLEETQNELSAWKFTPDSNTGKRLMAKCRLLYQENEELGKMTSNGRLAKLETELAMQKSLCEAVRKSQSECDDLVQELDEDIEGMESTILYLQQELQALQDRYEALEKENLQLKSGLLTAEKDRPALMGAPDEMHPKLNGTPMITSAAGDVYQQQINADVPHTNASSSYPAATHPGIVGGHLETIDENECIHSTTTTTSVQHDYYNGSGAAMAAEEPQQPMADDATDMNCLPSKFRSMASRKRTYEAAAVDSSEVGAPVGGVINSAAMQPVNVVPMYATQSAVPPPVSVSVHVPRTLPPKKSKLRGVTPVRRNSAQSDDIMVENNGGSGVYNASAAPMTPTEQMPPQCNDNNAPATVMTVNDEESEETVTVDTGSGGVVAQRIMTRRRSVRQCVKAADPSAIIE